MILTDDQRLLQDTVSPFMAEEGAIKQQLRHWRDTGCTDGYGTGLWEQFAELGLTGILIPEDQGGAGLGELRQDRRDPGAARGRPDPARPVGQAGRGLLNP